MISVMNKRQEDKGENHGLNDLAIRLREAVSRPLDEWREVYEGFSPVDLETGERRPRVPQPGADTRRAAVLVPIIVEGEDARVVYTVRKDDLADHAGQISFPGGSIEARDGSLLQTALREAEEEIDLRPELVEVVGELEEMYIPPSNFRVSPFVGLLPPEAGMVLAPDEVEEIFTVSLATLTANETFRKVLWRRDGSDYELPLSRGLSHETSGARRLRLPQPCWHAWAGGSTGARGPVCYEWSPWCSSASCSWPRPGTSTGSSLRSLIPCLRQSGSVSPPGPKS
jgi:8-oxo-dGTP pyrophosphatase MutT (NUDIX family)